MPISLNARTFCCSKTILTIARQSEGDPDFYRLLPQFVTVGSPTSVGQQFFWLGLMFLLLEWLAIAIYAWLGSHLQRWFSQPRPRRLFNRGSAVLLGCAGAGLLAARR
ncbi:threonine/homoserine/homoserine lactone efflux protein [Pseudomonas sp. TE3610]